MKAHHAPSKEEILEGLLSPPAGSPPEFQILAAPFRFGGDRGAEALAVDSVGRLTLVFLGHKDEEPWLLSMMDAISWMERHRSLLATRFRLPSHTPGRALRLVLAAPDFSKEFRARIETIGSAKTDLFEWEAVEMTGEKKLVFQRVLPSKQTGQTEDFPAWALEPQGASFFRDAVEKVAKIDPDISLDWGPGCLDLRFRGRILASLCPNATGLRIRMPGESESDLLVGDRTQLTKALDRIFREYVGSELEVPQTASAGSEADISKKNAWKADSSARPSLTAEEMEAIAK